MTVLDGATVTDTAGDGGWAPMLVTAVLAEPVIGLDGHPAHLDGPLAKAAYWDHVRAHGHGSLPPMTARKCVDFPLPLATWTRPAPGGAHPLALTGDGLAWGWCCSRAIYQADGHATVNVRKRPATGPAARYARDRSWDLGGGPTKARDVPFGAVLTRQVSWHCLGDPREVARMVADVPALGALTGHGHGRVLEWRVEEGGARDAWADRVLPDPAGIPGGSIRAPYHHLTRRMPCSP